MVEYKWNIGNNKKCKQSKKLLEKQLSNSEFGKYLELSEDNGVVVIKLNDVNYCKEFTSFLKREITKVSSKVNKNGDGRGYDLKIIDKDPARRVYRESRELKKWNKELKEDKKKTELQLRELTRKNTKLEEDYLETFDELGNALSEKDKLEEKLEDERQSKEKTISENRRIEEKMGKEIENLKTNIEFTKQKGKQKVERLKEDTKDKTERNQKLRKRLSELEIVNKRYEVRFVELERDIIDLEKERDEYKKECDEYAAHLEQRPDDSEIIKLKEELEKLKKELPTESLKKLTAKYAIGAEGGDMLQKLKGYRGRIEEAEKLIEQARKDYKNEVTNALANPVIQLLDEGKITEDDVLEIVSDFTKYLKDREPPADDRGDKMLPPSEVSYEEAGEMLKLKKNTIMTYCRLGTLERGSEKRTVKRDSVIKYRDRKGPVSDDLGSGETKPQKPDLSKLTRGRTYKGPLIREILGNIPPQKLSAMVGRGVLERVIHGEKTFYKKGKNV